MNGLIVLGIFVLVLYVVVRLAATAGAWLSGSRYRAYRQLAARYAGRYESRGLVDPPTVSFTHGHSSVRVGLAPTIPGQPAIPRTRVVARFARGLPLRLELAPISRPAPPQPPRGTRLVRTGSAEFDRAYVVQANDPEMAREFLNPIVRLAVENLRRMAPPHGMLVSVNPERLLVQVDRNLAAMPGALEYAVREALEVHDGLCGSVAARVAEGIAIVGAGEADPADAGPPVCKVCGEPIDEAQHHVVCVACKTPHHRDCWVFVGGCSIFGCQGKQCVPA